MLLRFALMAGRLRARSTLLAWGATSLMLAFLLVTGACLIHDQDTDHHHAMSFELCLGLLAVSSIVVLPARPLAVGWASVPSRVPVYTVAVHVPDPPPKLRSLA